MSKILIKNIGCLYTGKMDQPKLDANSILMTKLSKIGNDLTDDEATVIDAKGTTVMPGLLDVILTQSLDPGLLVKNL